jgi:predicted deacylase
MSPSTSCTVWSSFVASTATNRKQQQQALNSSTNSWEAAQPAFLLLRRVAILIVPVANPDGAWRKRRHNGLGQDLNRDWENGRSPEVSAMNSLVAAWQPHLVVDVHQWVPGDSTQTPMAEASGGFLGRRVASAMASAVRAKGMRLSYRTHGVGGSLCHRYWGARGIPAILLETVHRPNSPRQRQIAIQTTVIALQRALDILAG